jgi:hypothetical protein
MKRKRKIRSRIIIDSKFQRWFLINFVVYTGILLSIFAAILVLWFRLVTAKLIEAAGNVSASFQLILSKHLSFGQEITIYLFFILLFASAFFSYLLSRKIAGPIFSIQRQLDRIESGEIDPHQFQFRLRKNDQFRGLIDRLNRLISGSQEPRV